MLNDLTPIVLDFPQGENIVIHPIADIHYGSPQFKEVAWNRFVDSILKKNNHYLVIAGDAMNNALKSSVSNIYDETCRPSEQKRWVANQLRPLKDKILCGTGGNHERRSERDADDDPLYDIFSKLDIEDRYRGNAAFLILRIGAGNSNITSAKRPTYTMCVTHGAGNGMYIGSSANKAERFGMAIDGLDVLVTGHTHKPLTFPAQKLLFDSRNKNIVPRQFIVVTATSWLDYGGYPIQKMMTPVAFRPNEIWLSGNGKEARVLQ